MDAKQKFLEAMVVAQMAERLFPTSDVHISNPVIGQIYIEHLLSTVLKRRGGREWPI